MLVEIFILSIIALVVVIIWSRRQAYQLRTDMGIDGPPANLIFGNAIQLRRLVEKSSLLLSAFEEWKRIYGKIYGFYLGPKLFVMVEDTNMIKDIFIKQFSCFTDRQDMFMLRKSLIVSLINLRGAQWKHVRNIITPTFSTMRMKQMSSIIIHKADALCSNLLARADSGETFDLYTDFKTLTVDVIAKCAFAMDSNALNDVNDRFFNNVRQFFTEIPTPETSVFMQLGVIFPEVSDWCRDVVSLFSKQAKAEDWLFENLMKVIEERKKNYKTFESVDILQALLEQCDTVAKEAKSGQKKSLALSDMEIVNNCFVFLLAGYETTSTALGFTGWLLATHPDVQAKLQLELDNSVTAKEEITYEVAMRLPYLDAVFHESLRIFPPVMFFTNRTCVQDCVVNGIPFKKGVQVGVPVYQLHHDPDLWPDPEAFKPDRFYNNKDWDPMSWMPFGVGPRNCVGLRFAEMEYKITLARLLYQMNIDQTENTETAPLPLNNPTAMLGPKQVTVKVSRRTF